MVGVKGGRHYGRGHSRSLGLEQVPRRPSRIPQQLTTTLSDLGTYKEPLFFSLQMHHTVFKRKKTSNENVVYK